MAISKNGLTIFSLLLTLTILETGNFIECSSLVLPVQNGEEDFLPHTREKRSALLAPVEYTVDVELNVTTIETLDYLRSLLHNGSFTLALGPTVNVTDVDITTDFSVYPRTTLSPSTAPPVLYEYIISVELNTTDITLINQLRTTLRSLSYPFRINNHIQISEA
ncbi:hypothetical protein FQN60_016036, partial [Etheostoma spectabile]